MILLFPTPELHDGAGKRSIGTGREYKRGQSLATNRKKERKVILMVGRE
jgi:hypothetical protein